MGDLTYSRCWVSTTSTLSQPSARARFTGMGSAGAAVQVEAAPEFHHGGKQGDGGRGAQQAALVGHERLLAEIDGAAGDHVGDAGDKFRGGGEKSGVVEGIVFAWNVVEDEIHAEHRAGFDKVAQADVPPVAQIVHIHPVGPALLAGHEGNTVARAGGDADDIIRRQLPFHQGVEHADRVQAPHAAALEHQSEFHPISLS